MNQRSSKVVVSVVVGVVLLMATGLAAFALYATGWGMQFTD